MLISLPTWSQNNEEIIKESLKAFKLGTYQKSIDLLQDLDGDSKILSTKFYMMGLAYNRLQEYEQSLIMFSKAKKFGSEAEDLYYEYGQALYANSDLEKARKSFQLSYNNNYKKSSSLYYMAHISQLLDQHKKAKALYLKVIKEERKDQRLVQVARFQLSESLLAMAEKRPDAESIVKKYIIPQLNKALKYLPKSPLSNEIRERKAEIERRFFLDPNLMRNGKVLPKKKWNVLVNQDIAYDNNVTFDTQAPTAGSTESESYILNTYFSTSYLFSHKGLYTFSPRLDVTRAKHTDETNSTIFTNDSYSITASLNNTFEHRLFGKQATFHLDFGHTYYALDKNQEHKNTFFSRTNRISLAESFNYFRIGQTKVNVDFQELTGYTEGISYKNLIVGIEQTGVTKRGHLWIFSSSASFFDNFNEKERSTNQFSFNLNYYIPNFFYKTTLSMGMNTSFLDTKRQQSTRGTEKMYSPSLSLIRELNKNVTVTFSNTYTRNKSDDLNNFDYKKNVTSLAFTLSY